MDWMKDIIESYKNENNQEDFDSVKEDCRKELEDRGINLEEIRTWQDLLDVIDGKFKSKAVQSNAVGDDQSLDRQVIATIDEQLHAHETCKKTNQYNSIKERIYRRLEHVGKWREFACILNVPQSELDNLEYLYPNNPAQRMRELLKIIESKSTDKPSVLFKRICNSLHLCKLYTIEDEVWYIIRSGI